MRKYVELLDTKAPNLWRLLCAVVGHKLTTGPDHATYIYHRDALVGVMCERCLGNAASESQSRSPKRNASSSG